MLQLKNITKRYEAGEFSVNALKGVSLSFRKSEFVSILGPSGCGKTTMLNIVGGLDKYTDGDLIINGKSTKNFNDRDWDAYRNHSIGFVFQSYNLIPHQTVLQNVELALALSGVNRAERVARAKAALDKVGLANMYHKRPREMSGGQMQRVAIARAIVNNPDIILADEPTGALDTETSVQVMEILKEISKDRLVVMVTHNPDLAERYSTRIVRMLDGLLVEDSRPLSEEELAAEEAADKKHLEEEAQKGKKARKKLPKMSFATSFLLSLKNLFTKRGRAVLTSFAGSIGIIGIALIFAVSQGTTNYIATVQEDTLASYPLTIQQSNTDLTSMLASFIGSAETKPHENDAVYEKMVLYNLTNSLSHIEQSENDLASYKKHLDSVLADKESTLSQALNGVHYAYNLDLLIYTQYKGKDGKEDEVMLADTSDIMMDMVGTLYGVDMSQMSLTGGGMLSLMFQSGSTMSMWQELLPETDGGSINKLLKDQYDLVYGKWPDSGSSGKNQIVLVVDSKNEIDDMTLFALGLKPREEIDAIIDAARKGEAPPATTQKRWTFEEICSQKYKTIFNYECYKQMGNTWYDVREIGNNLEVMYNDPNVGMDLEVVGIIRPNASASSHILTGNICYTHELTKYVIERAQDSEIAKVQKSNPNVDVFTGKYFQNNNLSTSEKAKIFRDYIENGSEAERAEAYLAINSIPTQKEIDKMQATLNQMADDDPDGFRQMLISALKNSQTGAQSSQVEDYITNTDIENLKQMIASIVPSFVEAQKRMAIQQMFVQNFGEGAQTAMAQQMYNDVFGTADVEGYTDARCEMYFDTVIPFSENSYDDNLVTLGCLDISAPSSISLYPISFAAKEVLEEDIAAYNEGVDKEHKIEYTDYIGLMMSSITTIINAITYVLIAFVSISLIVSSIMIGVITLISVQERTKEIGILRAIGASKRNVSGMFNAETLIIGFTSGLFGVLITYVLCIFVNLILHSLTGILTLNATLPIGAALVLIGISMLLTLISGIIPSRSAAKKDPVVALRTE